MPDRKVVLLVVAAAVALACSEVDGAFEIDPLTPAERGVQASVVLGMIDAPFSLPRAMSGDASWRGAVAVNAFRPFGCEEIDFGQVRLALPVGDGRHVLGISYLRLKAYSYIEESYDLRISANLKDIKIKPVVRVGTMRWQDRWLDWAVVFDLELEARIRRNIKIRVGLDNPFGMGLAKEGSRCPTRLSVGLGCSVTAALAWGMDVEKQAGWPTSVKTGIEWALAGPLAVRAGIRTYPEEVGVGVGIGLGYLVIDASTSLNLELGATHQIGATFVWG
jgi:hypothetical protein